MGGCLLDAARHWAFLAVTTETLLGVLTPVTACGVGPPWVSLLLPPPPPQAASDQSAAAIAAIDA
jgi:hypothetical protein